MARSLPPFTWKNGFIQPAEDPVPAWADKRNFTSEKGIKSHYLTPPDGELPTSTIPNSYGLCHLRSWPTLYNGTCYADAGDQTQRLSAEVDVLICGGGPFGLELALTLARQNISFRIVDKAESPCLSGRADGLQPRAVEYLQSWGIGSEATEEGPILNSTVLYRNGVKLFHGPSTMCDSRNKGVHIITQGQLEKIYIRDLARHDVLVERNTTVQGFNISASESAVHPVKANLQNIKTGELEVIRAKYLIGADGAASRIREQMEVPFDGLATDCYWTIMDCQFKTDYPHILGFNIIISAEHGGTIIIPRENGFTRFYVQVTGDAAAKIRKNRQDARSRNQSSVGETQIHEHGITPDEALELLNRIISPWNVEFASELSWFAVWRVNERVARFYSSPDQRVHIGGDAAHVHSVLGAFGLNSSIYDAANLGWKLGMSIRGIAKPEVLLPTYDMERRLFANRVIRCSGAYLRFICNLNAPLAELRGLSDELEVYDEDLPLLNGTTEVDLAFLRTFFKRNAMFLLGVEGPVVDSVICPSETSEALKPSKTSETRRATSIRNGVRAPSPRVAFNESETGYLYDYMKGIGRFHIIIFASDLQGPIHEKLCLLSHLGFSAAGFYSRFGGPRVFNVLLVVKTLPCKTSTLLQNDAGLSDLLSAATVIYDDRAPDEDAHYCYGINHARGALVVVRPDLMVGISAWPEDTQTVEKYFLGFLNGRLPN